MAVKSIYASVGVAALKFASKLSLHRTLFSASCIYRNCYVQSWCIQWNRNL